MPTDTPAKPPIWLLSPWDHKVHAFEPTMIGELIAQAICDHTARTSATTLAEPHQPKCLACLMLHGADLANRYGDSDRYAP